MSFTLDGRIECWLCLLHGVDMSSRESHVPLYLGLHLRDARKPALCSDTTLLVLLDRVQLSAHPCSLAILIDVVMFGD